MTATVLPELPPDLAAKAAEVPGLSTRLLLFIRQEVALHEKRQSRYSAQAKEIVRQVKEKAAEMRAAGVTPAQGRQEFQELYTRLVSNLPADPCAAP